MKRSKESKQMSGGRAPQRHERKGSKANSKHSAQNSTLRRCVMPYGVEVYALPYCNRELLRLRHICHEVEIRINPHNLGTIEVREPGTSTYFRVPAVDERYSEGLTLKEHKRNLNRARELHRKSAVSLGEAYNLIRELIRSSAASSEDSRSVPRFLDSQPVARHSVAQTEIPAKQVSKSHGKKRDR